MGCRSTVIRDLAIAYFRDGELRGRMSWVEHPRLYIDFLWADDPSGLAPMFAAFRKKYPDTLVYFEAAEDNERMRRFIELVGATKNTQGCYFTNTSRRITMDSKTAKEFGALSAAGMKAYTADCEAESPSGDGGYPKTKAKLRAGYYRNM